MIIVQVSPSQITDLQTFDLILEVPYDDILKQNTFGSKFGLKRPDFELMFDLNLSEYQRMSDAIASVAQSTGKPPLIFSLCEWGWVSSSWSTSCTEVHRLHKESSLDLGKTSRAELACSG